MRPCQVHNVSVMGGWKKTIENRKIALLEEESRLVATKI